MNKVFFGDCRDSMRDLIAQGIKVQMCVTSPPYYGLRDYGHDGQLGLEATPDEFVDNLVEVFGLVRELLTDDGVLWLNLGDSYAGSGKGSNPDGTPHPSTLAGKQGTNTGTVTGINKPQKAAAIGLKPKDLIGIPWMVAFALRADGWYLRQDIIWHKPNPMPESVTDRCTKSHEYIFLLSKSARYYFDSAAIAEPLTESSRIRNQSGWNGNEERDYVSGKQNNMSKYLGSEKAKEATERNKRSVWTVPTTPYSGAHFATFPPALIEPCILAGSRIGDTVLDPFFGSGTTGQVSQALGRKWIGCELNPAYGELQQVRTAQQGMEFV